MLTAFALLRKFGIAEIIPGPRGPVDSLVPLHPDLVREDVTTSGQHRYWYSDPKKNFQERPLLSDEVFVLRGKLGRSILDFAKDSLGAQLATERFQGLLFSRGAKFAGVVSHPKLLQDPTRTAIRAALDEYAIGGPRAGRPLLLEDGMTWENAAMTSAEAQMVENLKWGLLQVCRWFRVQPSKVQDLSDAHYANVEQAAIDYVVDTILSWAIRWEQAIRRDLIINKVRFFARHNLEGLLRGDSQARAAFYSLAIMWGWMTRNEVRAKENLNPLKGLDDPLTPLNMGVGRIGPDGKPAAMLLLPETIPNAARGQLKLLASDLADRIIRRETAAIGKLAERSGSDAGAFAKGVEEFYAEHANHVAGALHVPVSVAKRYASDQRQALLADGPAVMDDWPVDRAAYLTSLAMDQEELAA
jgi:HK97 family phage portal protein